MSISYVAPTGSPIQGIMQHDNGTWAIEFGRQDDTPTGFDFLADGPDAEWNNVTVADSPLFVDDDGEMWLAHHLLREEASDDPEERVEAIPLPYGITSLFQVELALGEAWEAAKLALAGVERARAVGAELSAAGSIMVDGVVDVMRAAERQAACTYAIAKEASLMAMRGAL